MTWENNWKNKEKFLETIFYKIFLIRWWIYIDFFLRMLWVKMKGKFDRSIACLARNLGRIPNKQASYVFDILEKNRTDTRSKQTYCILTIGGCMLFPVVSFHEGSENLREVSPWDRVATEVAHFAWVNRLVALSFIDFDLLISHDPLKGILSKLLQFQLLFLYNLKI